MLDDEAHPLHTEIREARDSIELQQAKDKLDSNAERDTKRRKTTGDGVQGGAAQA